MGVTHIGVMGGEPFVRQDLYDIIALCRQHEVEPWVVTNGVLTSYDVLKTARDSGLRHIAFSMDGLKPEHERIRGTNTFAPVSESVKAAVDLGLFVRINSVIMRSNKDSIVGLMDSLMDRVDMFKFSYFTPSCHEAIGEMLHSEEWTDYIKQIFARFQNRQHTQIRAPSPFLETHSSDVCHLVSPFVASDGHVYACCKLIGEHPLGSITEESFCEIWNRDWAFNRTHSYCIGMSALCTGDISVPVENYAELGSMYYGCPLLCTRNPV
jgi:MoaA/NifB/PqqE/SkfB family radical SAM enzyme